jgi:aspartate aminotransferase-like enzyme
MSLDPALNALLLTARHVPTVLLPGPTLPTPAIRAALADSNPLAVTNPAYGDLYHAASRVLAELAGTRAPAVLLAGPSALGHWAALRSLVTADQSVAVLGSGPVADDLADVAELIAGRVLRIPVAADGPIDVDAVAREVAGANPDAVALVHVEPTTGSLMPVAALVTALRVVSEALIVVDVRATVGGLPLDLDAWGVDVAVLAADYCLSVPIDVAVLTLSERAWAAAAIARYRGYEALGRWQGGLDNAAAPFAPASGALAALVTSARAFLDEGAALVAERHADLSRYVRDRARRLGLDPYPTDGLRAAPTLTAIRVPEGVLWSELDAALQERGVMLASGDTESGAPLVIIGHMGNQAELAIVKRGLDALAEALPLAEPV